MLRWALAFLVLALLTALLGTSGAGLLRTLFYVFFIMFAVSFVAGLKGSRRSTA